MNVEPMTFSQKWESTFSKNAAKSYIHQAFYYDIATVTVIVGAVAILVGAVALPILAGLVVSYESALNIGYVAAPVIGWLASKLIEKFVNRSRNLHDLANQASEVNAIFERLKAENPNIVCPEGKALRDYWKKGATDSYQLFHDTRDIECKTFAIKTAQLEIEQNAAITKIGYLFWKTLSENENSEKFEEIFLDHGINAYSAISKFATWDLRTTENRIVDLAKSSNVLLIFNNRDIEELSYSAVLDPASDSSIESRFAQALAPEPIIHEEAV
jgi:hypothetical protein